MATTILIVDDSLTVRMDLSEAFRTAGLQTVPCASLEEARESLTRGGIGLVVLDVVLPDGDGVEFLRELRTDARFAGIPVLLLSSEAEVRDRIRGLKTGADEYIGKPYDTTYVISRVAEIVRTRWQSLQPEQSTILLIDDSASFRQQMRELLESADHKVIDAVSGEEGLRLAAELRPTAIVVDGILPGIDGATVIRKIRLDAALRDTPCLLLTASEERSEELRALDAGADAFIRKGEDASLVLARLHALVRRIPSTGSELWNTKSLLAPKRILAVDDSLTYLHEISDALRASGYDVAMARSGEEALELLAVQSVDCILLDLLMPGLGGQETCRRIKAAPGLRDIPLLMLTALEDHGAMIEGLSAGADDYIAKSCDLEVLKARVLAQLRRRQFERETRRIREQLLQTELEAAEARAAHELAEARAELIQELERKNRELETFSYSVSHDPRAPLRSIDGFSQALLEDYAPDLDGKGRDYLRRVRAAAQRMGELIDDLLQLSRVGRMELRREPTDLSTLAGVVARELVKTAPDRDVNLRVQEGLVASGDRRLLRIALENLLGNAWKFTGSVPAPAVEVGAREQDGEISYFVRDNGVGFDMSYADKLFSPFQRLHGETEFPGTGIGLATVQRVVDRHGGRVWAESAPGAGATFWFTIPAPKGGKDA